MPDRTLSLEGVRVPRFLYGTAWKEDKTQKLTEDLELHSGKPFMTAVREADKNRMLLKYGEIGFIDAQIVSEPRFTNQLGIVDLVYKIEERDPYMMGELRIEGNGRDGHFAYRHSRGQTTESHTRAERS